ncbi:hypothetical protein [Chitinophaga sp. Cy-1792]|uniref:hypothetical protein n=1 Tax=Chitinophaga sp. Cy-1792 TaxID=2608339 RepID=UPI00141FD4E3|nr:hypothetical protein [Chitinophaga sp. Cy-1792]NIG55366.1 hypothetical protein [Chitinophaga sp. Cy-1792]
MKKYCSIIIISIVIFQLLGSSCKKVDDHAAMVSAQPWLANNFSSNKFTWTYPSMVTVGDTVSLVGRLFPKEPGTTITVGGVPVTIVDTMKLAAVYTTYSSQPELDVVRFVVTKEMGLGTRRPVTVTAHGVTVTGPDLTIQYIKAGANRTDSTLWVDKLFTWLPANPADYTRNYDLMVNEVHVDGNGNVLFGNAHGIYQYAGGGVKELLKNGDQLNDGSGNFTLRNIVGATISFDGNTLYFSSAVVEPSADTVANYIFRLCTMDIASKKVTTLNRTLVTRSRAGTNESGVRLEGLLSKVKLAARNLEVALNGNLYFVNFYAPASTTDDQSYWYQTIIMGDNTAEPWSNNEFYIGKSEAGQVTMMASFQFGPNHPGPRIGSSQYFIDPNDKYLYAYTLSQNYNFQLAVIDANEGNMIKEVPGAGNPLSKFLLQSYEWDPKYKVTGIIGLVACDPTYLFHPNMQLTDGSVLTSSASLVNYDLLNGSAYCYAGTEKGMEGYPPAEQNQTLGLAKWIDFTNASLIGQDKTGAVYFCKGIGDYTNGVSIYKIYPKKS